MVSVYAVATAPVWKGLAKFAYFSAGVGGTASEGLAGALRMLSAFLSLHATACLRLLTWEGLCWRPGISVSHTATSESSLAINYSQETL